MRAPISAALLLTACGRFKAVTIPVERTASKFRGEVIPGIPFVITNRLAYRPVRTSLLLIDEIRRQHPRTPFLLYS